MRPDRSKVYGIQKIPLSLHFVPQSQSTAGKAIVDRQEGVGGLTAIAGGWGEAWRGERADGLEKSANARIAQ